MVLYTQYCRKSSIFMFLVIDEKDARFCGTVRRAMGEKPIQGHPPPARAFRSVLAMCFGEEEKGGGRGAGGGGKSTSPIIRQYG